MSEKRFKIGDVVKIKTEGYIPLTHSDADSYIVIGKQASIESEIAAGGIYYSLSRLDSNNPWSGWIRSESIELDIGYLRDKKLSQLVNENKK